MTGATVVPPWDQQCAVVYREHAASITRLARLLLQDEQEAQEVTQEVFLKVIDACQGSRAPREWKPWLTRVTVNACRDRQRSWWWRRGRGRGGELEDVNLAEAGAGPDRLALAQEVRERIWQAFGRLPERQRAVFALRHVEGWSTGQVAEALEVSEGSVKRHLFRAVHRLRRALEDLA